MQTDPLIGTDHETLRTCVLRHPTLRWNSTAQVTDVHFVHALFGHINYATTVVTCSRGIKRENLPLQMF